MEERIGDIPVGNVFPIVIIFSFVCVFLSIVDFCSGFHFLQETTSLMITSTALICHCKY